MSMTSSDDENEGKSKRITFQRLSQRLETISVAVDIDHIAAVKQDSSTSSHIQMELENLRGMDSTVGFKRFYYKLWPLVQSLPEILHHLSSIVTLLCDSIASIHDESLPSLLTLLSMLCKDALEDIAPFFPTLMKSLTDRIAFSAKKASIEVFNPELVGKIMETISYVLKYFNFTSFAFVG